MYNKRKEKSNYVCLSKQVNYRLREDKMSTIGARITKTRKERGYNQRHLCKLADIQETTLSRYENGTREPQAKIIAKISKALNVSSDYLINGDSVNEEKYDIVSKVTLGYEASKKVKCNYIKEIISELRESSLQSVDDLVSEFGVNFPPPTS